MVYVIACGDEGVQMNEGTRLAFVGAGFRLEGFSEVVPILKKIFGDDLRIVASEECDWIRQQLALSNWEQTNASAQQHVEALADQEKLLYAGYFPFSDPKQLKHEVKGHMVRPHKVHIANKICFTVGGGEQKYNLGHFVISADWVAKAPEKLVKQVLQTQVNFYSKLVGDQPLPCVVEETGELGEKKAEANKKTLQKLGFLP
ncbi:MAG: hypothetical protein COY81_01715 [Candidatus Pacebacteria bacterium CG_4_10_14_0_8_um_filter_43_12]|nr:MAG: hypothetical protein COU66_01280 [Candidatus Pacebacteria bacterium CG10_big_fil_rev_8_21_14_0_10_44_11]PIY79570.1 MAG: hypothetical protein COY81_01715 [Candidatus Pacebacteria bacterium CG_4_10_14_0_8_um_filter_43_12]